MSYVDFVKEKLAGKPGCMFPMGIADTGDTQKLKRAGIDTGSFSENNSKSSDMRGGGIAGSNFACWVYGLGTIGRLFIDLCRIYKYPIAGIIVGNGYKSEDNYKNVEIYEINSANEEINAVSREGAILFYTVKQEKDKVLDELEWNAENVVDISSRECYQHMLRMYYSEYFESKDVEIQNENELLLNFGSFRCINPKFFKKEWLYSAFLSEIGDLLLPPIYSDYNRIDEGDYEDGFVKIEKDDVVIDCGANIGLFSAIAAWRGGKVYAFEPVDEVFQYLKIQAELYRENIYPVRKALSDFCGASEIYIGETGEQTEGSLLKNDLLRKENIECTMLDTFVEEKGIDKVDFIKADIEGAERDMLRGASKVLAKYAPKLSICTYHREDDREVLSNIIWESNPNYKIIYKWKKLYAYVDRK